MIERLGSEILALIVKEIAAQTPAIAAAIVKELSDVSDTMYKYIVASIEDDKIDTKQLKVPKHNEDTQ